MATPYEWMKNAVGNTSDVVRGMNPIDSAFNGVRRAYTGIKDFGANRGAADPTAAGAAPPDVAAAPVPPPVAGPVSEAPPAGLRYPPPPPPPLGPTAEAAAAAGNPVSRVPAAASKVGMLAKIGGPVGSFLVAADQANLGREDYNTLTKPTDSPAEKLEAAGGIAAERGTRAAGIMAASGAMYKATGGLPWYAKLPLTAAAGVAGGYGPELAAGARNAWPSLINPADQSDIGTVERGSNTALGGALASSGDTTAARGDWRLPSERADAIRNPTVVGTPTASKPTPEQLAAAKATQDAMDARDAASVANANASEAASGAPTFKPPPSDWDTAALAREQLSKRMAGGGVNDVGSFGDRGNIGLRTLGNDPAARQLFNDAHAADHTNIVVGRDSNGRATFSNTPGGEKVPDSGVRFASDQQIAAYHAGQARDAAAAASQEQGGGGPSYGNSIGGLVVGNHARKQQALDIEQARLAQGARQFGITSQLDRDRLDETRAHNQATVQNAWLTQQREGLRDLATNDIAKRTATVAERASFGEYGDPNNPAAGGTGFKNQDMTLRRSADARAQVTENERIRAEGSDKYNKLMTESLPLGSDGKVDQGVANFHTSSVKQGIADRIDALNLALKKNPGNTTAQKDLYDLQSKSVGAMDDNDRQRMFAGAEFARLAADKGTGSLTPWGATNVQSLSPATHITLKHGLTGDVYVDQLKREVPARHINKVGGSYWGGTKNAQFDMLK